MARLGQLLRSKDPLATFEIGPNPFAAAPYADRVRHVALLRRGPRLYVFFTGNRRRAGARPALDDRSRAGLDDVEGLCAGRTARPAAAYECANLPNVPSAAGEIDGPAQQLRDPAIFEEAGKTYLFYSICGEQGLAAAELTFR